jgi:ABC-type sugar transport system permease subunit
VGPGDGVPARRRATRHADTRAAFLLLTPALAILGFTYAYPLVELVRFSLHRRGREEWTGLDNFRLLLSDTGFWASVEHNFELLVIVPVIVVIATLVAALLRDQIRGWKLYRVIVFMPHVLPVVVAGVAFGFVLQTHGPLNALLEAAHLPGLAQDWLGDPRFALGSVAGVIVWRQAGFGVVLLLARMVQIPLELYESARLDGAGWWQTLWHVTVPQLRTVLAFYVGMIVIELFSWVFNYIYVLTKGGPGLSTYVSEYYIYDRAFGYDQMGIGSAFSLLVLTTVLVGTFVYFGWLRRRDVF